MLRTGIWLSITVSCLFAASCTPVKNKRGANSSTDAAVDAAVDPDDSSCRTNDECPVATPCTDVRCENGRCVTSERKSGTPVADDQQTEGDCRKLVCAERGQIRVEDDDTDSAETDGNPCHALRCEGGDSKVVMSADGTSCNGTGTCQAGQCSVCNEGVECSRSSDCTIFRMMCRNGSPSCEDSGEPRPGRACEVGKVCHMGSCVPCVVGAECEVDEPCRVGRIASCGDGLICEPQPQSGAPCGTDEMGRMKYCVSGECTTPCREGPCMTANNACETSHWDCSDENSTPACVSLLREDGEDCGGGASCHAGACVTHSLVNGDFGRGLEGWTTTGDGNNFPVTMDAANDDRLTVSTALPGSSGGAARGTVSQTFTVPSDALAMRFNVFGGRGHVRLKNASGTVLEDVTGGDTTGTRVPVSWDLDKRRGESLTIAIEDDLGSGEWPYIGTTGFDIVRDVNIPLRNPRFDDGFADWETTGDGLHFNLFEDYNYATSDSFTALDPAYGRRRSLSSYSRDPAAAAYGDGSRGTVSQTFLVPNDAVAIRFAVHGGSEAWVKLFQGTDEVYRVTALISDYRKLPVSWSLVPLRGKTVRLAIEDAVTLGPYGYIGTTGFDVITAYNGP